MSLQILFGERGPNNADDAPEKLCIRKNVTLVCAGVCDDNWPERRRDEIVIFAVNIPPQKVFEGKSTDNSQSQIKILNLERIEIFNVKF